ncbi:MAG TPA: efflux RND transporter permease subunit, partial [Polyangiaceae bacterium]|nr:efflux RND transporter permease subunit [Polyangiaceae bacterium]
MPIANFAVSRRVTVTMMATAIIILGIFAFPRLPVDLLPSFQPPIVSVAVSYGNVAPDIMESTVTRPIENAVARVSGIDYLQSSSFQGQSQVRAVFKYGTDINVAEVDIQQQISRITNQLPNDPNLQPPQIQKADPNALPVVFMYITDPSRTQRDLNDLFTNYLADEFASIPGVGSATVSGGQTRAIMVEPNQVALAANGLTNASIIQKISNENVNDPAGIIAVGPKEFGIRTNALYKSAAEIANTVVAIKGGAPIYLRDVAAVSDSIEEQRLFTRMTLAGGGPGAPHTTMPAIRMAITAQPDANVVSTADGIYAKIADLKKRYPTMNFTIALDQRGFIQDAIAALEHTAILGSVLAILIILLFLHSWRSTLIVSISLPVSVMGTLFAIYVTHQTLNTMTMGGLALAVGLIVDDAVVVIENIFRHLDEGKTPLAAARDATTQIFYAVLSSTVTVVTVFVPLILIPGLQGLIFGPLALTVMAGVAISLLVAVTTVPMLSSLVLKRGGSGHNDLGRFGERFERGYGRFESWYKRLLSWSLDHAALVLGVGAILFLITLGSLRFGIVATEQFPASDSRFARFDVRAPNGTSLAVTDKIARLVEQAFARDPRVAGVGVVVGSGFGGGVSRPITNQASLQVTLRPDIIGKKATAFVNEWQQRLGGQRRPGSAAATPSPAFAGLSPQERTAARAQFRALRTALVGTAIFGRTIDILQQQITQGADALDIQLYGPDYNKLYALAQGVIPQLATIPGVLRPDTNITPTQPEVDVTIDRRKAIQDGFSTGDIAADIATATSGTIASYYQVNGIQYPILVEAPPAQRRTFGALGTLPLIPTGSGSGGGSSQLSGLQAGTSVGVPAGEQTSGSSANANTPTASIPLSGVAAITQGVGPSQINRQDKQRNIDISANINGRPLGAIVADAQKVMDAYPLPNGYRWQFGPAITQNTDTFSAMALVVILAIALIYMLLASQFESFVD